MQKISKVKVALAESFKDLVKQVPIDKITIKDITDRAGVIRVTFYNHFQDKYDLLEWIIRNEILAPIDILLGNKMIKEALIIIFNNVLKDKEFYRKVAKLDGQNSFEYIVNACIYDILYDFIKNTSGSRSSKHPWLTNEHLAMYYAQSMTFIVVNWIKTGMSATPEEMAITYEYLIDNSMIDIVKDMV